MKCHTRQQNSAIQWYSPSEDSKPKAVPPAHKQGIGLVPPALCLCHRRNFYITFNSKAFLDMSGDRIPVLMRKPFIVSEKKSKKPAFCIYYCTYIYAVQRVDLIQNKELPLVQVSVNKNRRYLFRRNHHKLEVIRAEIYLPNLSRSKYINQHPEPWPMEGFNLLCILLINTF